MRKRWKLGRNDKKIKDPPSWSNIHITGPPETQSRKSRESSRKMDQKIH